MGRYQYYIRRNLTLARAARGEQPLPPHPYSRIGVNFTADQEATVKALVEKGDRVGAQRIILAQIEKDDHLYDIVSGPFSLKRDALAWAERQKAET